MRFASILFSLTFLAAATPDVARGLLPNLSIPQCSELIQGCTQAPCPQDPICVPISLTSNGARVASVGFTIQYQTSELGSANVLPGLALTGDQNLFSDEPSANSLRVTMTPPVQIPIPLIQDGVIAEVCLTPEQVDPAVCSPIIFLAADVGDDLGRDLAMETPTDGATYVPEPSCSVFLSAGVATLCLLCRARAPRRRQPACGPAPCR
jgi:hypothetical protein